MAGRDPNRLELRRALAEPDQQTPLTHEPLAPTPLPPTLYLVKQNKKISYNSVCPTNEN